jgi:hypothetical protein
MPAAAEYVALAKAHTAAADCIRSLSATDLSTAALPSECREEACPSLAPDCQAKSCEQLAAWEPVLRFYAALHWLSAYFFECGEVPPDNHGARKQLIKRRTELSGPRGRSRVQVPYQSGSSIAHMACVTTLRFKLISRSSIILVKISTRW